MRTKLLFLLFALSHFAMLTACKTPNKRKNDDSGISIEWVKKTLTPFSIEVSPDHIKLKDGRIIPQIPFRSVIERELNFAIGNENRSTHIYNEFEAIGNDFQNPNMHSDLGWWLVDHSLFLGVPYNDSWSGLKETELGKEILKDENLKIKVDEFFKKISYSYSTAKHPKKEHYKVALVTTSGGGGHLTAAKAIQKYLEDLHYEVTLVNHFELQKKFDSLCFITNCEWTSDLVYEKIFQQKGDVELARAYWNAGWVLRSYFPWSYNSSYLEEFEKINPDLILSTIHFHPNIIQPAYQLGKPVLFVATDYAMPTDMIPAMMLLQEPLGAYGVPTITKNTFSVMFDKALNPNFTRDQKWAESDRYQWIEKYWKGQINTKELKQHIPILHELGFPVQETFVRESNPGKLEEIKNKHAIDTSHRVVLVSMGKVGGQKLNTIVDSLIKEKTTLSKATTVVVICGENKELKEGLEKKIHKAHLEGSHLNIMLTDSLDRDQMRDFYNISDLMISKAGGGTSAELMVMNLPILIFYDESHFWEYGNVTALENYGLGQIYNPKHSMVKQIEHLLSRNLKHTTNKTPLDWKHALKETIETIINHLYE